MLDRLEARGFIRRARDPQDRRRQVVELVQQRTPEIERHFDRFLSELRRICSDYSSAELEVILDWLHRVTDAQRSAAIELTGSRTEA